MRTCSKLVNMLFEEREREKRGERERREKREERREEKIEEREREIKPPCNRFGNACFVEYEIIFRFIIYKD